MSLVTIFEFIGVLFAISSYVKIAYLSVYPKTVALITAKEVT